MASVWGIIYNIINNHNQTPWRCETHANWLCYAATARKTQNRNSKKREIESALNLYLINLTAIYLEDGDYCETVLSLVLALASMLWSAIDPLSVSTVPDKLYTRTNSIMKKSHLLQLAIGICRSFGTPMADLLTNNLLSSMFTDREKTVQRNWYTIGQITTAYFSATAVDDTAAHLRDLQTDAFRSNSLYSDQTSWTDHCVTIKVHMITLSVHEEQVDIVPQESNKLI